MSRPNQSIVAGISCGFAVVDFRISVCKPEASASCGAKDNTRPPAIGQDLPFEVNFGLSCMMAQVQKSPTRRARLFVTPGWAEWLKPLRPPSFVLLQSLRRYCRPCRRLALAGDRNRQQPSL
jgi:hypothetical protein